MALFGLIGKPDVNKLKMNNDIDGLITALRYKKDYFVRKTAADALGQIGNTRAVESLINTLNDEDYRVQHAAAFALGKIGDVRAIDPLITTLSDKDENMRISAADALGQIGDNRAVDPLITALKFDKGWLVRKNAALSLGRIGDVRAIDPLLIAFNNDEEIVRTSAATALGMFKSERAVDPLLELLINGDKNISNKQRKVAAQSLIYMYKAGTLDDKSKQKIVAVKGIITSSHDDRTESTGRSSDCTSSHIDQGIGLTF